MIKTNRLKVHHKVKLIKKLNSGFEIYFACGRVWEVKESVFTQDKSLPFCKNCQKNEK